MRALAAAAIALSLSLGAGCATPRAVKSGRKGLIDRLSELPSSHRSRGRAIAREDSEGFDQRLKAYRRVDLRWPLEDVKVTSNYGDRGREFHDGVDLHAARGTSVYAAHSGTVIYSGSRIRGYGRMVIVKHPTGLATVYAHCSRNLVREGQDVKQGQRIALSGNTGRSSGPHLHFEIRDGVNALDPLQFLHVNDLPSHALAKAEIEGEEAVGESAPVKPVAGKKGSKTRNSSRRPASLAPSVQAVPLKSKRLAKRN